MQLKEELTLIQWGDWSITENLHVVKALADEIAIIDHSISDDDLTLYVLNGLGPNFQEIVAPIKPENHYWLLRSYMIFGWTWDILTTPGSCDAELGCFYKFHKDEAVSTMGESPVVFQENWLLSWASRLSTRPQLK